MKSDWQIICLLIGMILLVTSSSRSNDCAVALRQGTGEDVNVANSLRAAATSLRTESYVAVVLDQYLFETELDEIQTVMERLGTAIPVPVNLAITAMQRLVQEVRAAVRRRQREEAAARKAALSTLHGELNSTVTALLLSCEMALGTPGLPSEAAEKMQCAHGLVKTLCSQLEEMG